MRERYRGLNTAEERQGSVDWSFLYSQKITAARDLKRQKKNPVVLPKRPWLLLKGKPTGIGRQETDDGFQSWRGDNKIHDASWDETRRWMGNAACRLQLYSRVWLWMDTGKGHHGDINHTWQPGDSRLDNRLNAWKGDVYGTVYVCVCRGEEGWRKGGGERWRIEKKKGGGGIFLTETESRGRSPPTLLSELGIIASVIQEPKRDPEALTVIGLLTAVKRPQPVDTKYLCVINSKISN